MIAFQTIQTKYLSPGNVRGARIKASTSGAKSKSLTIGYDHRLGFEANHVKAAAALARSLGWSGEYAAGALPNGFVFVLITLIDERGDLERCDGFVIGNIPKPVVGTLELD